MTEISSALTEINNLKAAWFSHHNSCKNPDCGVSLYLLRETIRRVAEDVWAREYKEVEDILKSIPIVG